MKKKTARQEFDDCRKGIMDSVGRWDSINENGCNDPAWPDGCNMNLVRNHVIYYKRRILEICSQEGFAVPEEFYFPVPPKVNDNYMANLDQKDRVKRLRQYGSVLVTGKVEFDKSQMSLL